MTGRVGASNKSITGHSCCGGEKVQAQAATVAIDPVCGMTVSPATAEKSSFQGRDVFFCSSGCHKKFDASPATFLGTAHQPMERNHG